MRNFYNYDSWLEPTFDLILYDPFRDIENCMKRQRIHRHITPYSFHYPSSLFSHLEHLDLEQQLAKKNAKNCPQVNNDGKSVMVKLNLPDHVDPDKINVLTRDGNLIVKIEDKIEKENSTTQFSYFQRFTLPKNTNLESMKAFVDDDGKEVSIQADLKEEEKIENIEEEKNKLSPKQIKVQHETQQIKN